MTCFCFRHLLAEILVGILNWCNSIIMVSDLVSFTKYYTSNINVLAIHDNKMKALGITLSINMHVHDYMYMHVDTCR